MKRLISFILELVLCLSVLLTVFAAEGEDMLPSDGESTPPEA